MAAGFRQWLLITTMDVRGGWGQDKAVEQGLAHIVKEPVSGVRLYGLDVYSAYTEDEVRSTGRQTVAEVLNSMVNERLFTKPTAKKEVSKTSMNRLWFTRGANKTTTHRPCSDSIRTPVRTSDRYQ